MLRLKTKLKFKNRRSEDVVHENIHELSAKFRLALVKLLKNKNGNLNGNKLGLMNWKRLQRGRR